MPPGIIARPGLGRREAENRLREQRKDDDAAVEAEAEHDEQEDRRHQVAVPAARAN